MEENSEVNNTEESKRKKFLTEIAYQVEGIIAKKEARKKFDEESERMKPTQGELADGYKEFINIHADNFLDIVEDLNMCLEIAKDYETIGNVQLKARIKDFSSSKINSNVKILDDIFGVELVSASEFDKEFLILFSYLMFDIDKNKKYRKEDTGYSAYHCLADFSPKNVDIQLIKELIKKTKTKEYRYTPKEYEKMGKEPKTVKVFPILNKKIMEEPEILEEIVEAFEEMSEFMNTIPMDRWEQLNPIIEFHFLTSEAERNALTGKAAHAKYKSFNGEENIKEKFRQGNLIRGINSPWKFVGTPEGLKLQDFYETLKENWPFLKDIVKERRKEGKEVGDRKKSTKFDIFTAAQFPFLRKYLPNKYEYSYKGSQEQWGLLRAILIVNSLDNTGSFEDTVLEELEGMWGDIKISTGGENTR